jgi:hypothetical protein
MKSSGIKKTIFTRNQLLTDNIIFILLAPDELENQRLSNEISSIQL